MKFAEARLASSVVLVRETGDGREVFWVRRGRDVSLGGGYYAFPGGRVDAEDTALAEQLGSEAERVAALRELFEETGVLVGASDMTTAALDEERRALLASERSFAQVLGRLNVRPAPERLVPAGRWITPPYLRVRFDTPFFALLADDSMQPVVWPGELADGEWVSTREALERWSAGRALLHPPALHVLRCLHRAPLVESAAEMCSPPHVSDYVPVRIEFQAGILTVPLRTPTLPPATHTNCYVVGEEEVVVIDPPSVYEEEQAALASYCDGLIAEGRRIREILLTHHHHDHVGGAEALRAHLNVPVRAHADAAELLEGSVQIDGLIEDGEVIELPGRLGLRLRAVHTPGHTRGHLCFLEERSGSLIAGDMVAGIGTIVVDPPEGDMSDYIASLRRLRALPVGAIYPSHGPVLPDGPRKLDEYLEHRADRERLVVEALRKAGTASAEELVPGVYSDVPEKMYPLAARSLTAVLLKLVKERQASTDGERFTWTGEAIS